MSDDLVISDSSALIGLEQIGQLELLSQLFGIITIPPAVAREVSPSVIPRDWMQEQMLSLPIPVNLLTARFGPGETEAIALALELHPTWIVLDERRARRLAESLELPVIGVLGILRLARLLGIISHLPPYIDALRSTRFFIDERLVKQLLDEFGENR